MSWWWVVGPLLLISRVGATRNNQNSGLQLAAAIILLALVGVWLIMMIVRYRNPILSLIGVRGRPGAELAVRRIATLSSLCIFLFALGVKGHDVLLSDVEGYDVLLSGALAMLPWLVFYAVRWVMNGFAGSRLE